MVSASLLAFLFPVVPFSVPYVFVVIRVSQSFFRLGLLDFSLVRLCLAGSFLFFFWSLIRIRQCRIFSFCRIELNFSRLSQRPLVPFVFPPSLPPPFLDDESSPLFWSPSMLWHFFSFSFQVFFVSFFFLLENALFFFFYCPRERSCLYPNCSVPPYYCPFVFICSFDSSLALSVLDSTFICFLFCRFRLHLFFY